MRVLSSTRPTHAPDPAIDPAAGAAGPTIELRPAEALWLAGAALFTAVSWASLATAHAGVQSAGSVLALAAGLLALLAGATRLGSRGRRVRLVQGWREVGVLAVAAGLLALLYLPGAAYGVADKDPGGYMAHAFWIARSGDFRIDDEFRARLPEDTRLYGPDARFPAMWIPDGSRTEVIPQFYHLYPATIAFAKRLVGIKGMTNLNALLAVASVLGLYLVGRRVFGVLAGVLAAAALGVNMIQVWQAKYPTTESTTQLLFLLVVLGLLVAMATRWRPPAALAGVALGVSWLARPDSIIPLVLALAVLALLFALGRWDGLHTWFLAGILLTLPHALYQAFVTAREYTDQVLPLTSGQLALLVALLVGGALLGRLLWGSALGRRVEGGLGHLVEPAGRRQALKALLPLALAALAVVGALRPWLFAPDVIFYLGRYVHTANEYNLYRMGFFVTYPGLVAALAGFAVLALRRWRADAWLAVGPALLLLVFYLHDSRVSARLMWWTRRYQPAGLVVLALLIGLACAVALAWRGRARLVVRLAGLGVVTAVLVSGLVQSVPLARHREFDGSFGVSARIAAAAGGRQGIFLWTAPRSSYDTTPLFAAPVWLQQGQLSSMLPSEATPGYLDKVKRAFPGQPVLVVSSRPQLPTGLRRAGLRVVDRFETNMPFWEETSLRVPRRQLRYRVRVNIWAVPD